MLRSVLDDIVRKRLWPIPALALLVAVAAPLLFLRSAEEPSPAVPVTAGAVAKAAKAGTLPSTAERLVTASEGRERRASGAAHDPFEPPASHRPAKPASAADGGAPKPAVPAQPAAPSAGPTKPVPVVIQDGGRLAPKASPTPRAPSRTSPARGRRSPSPIGRLAQVDVRFGKTQGARLRRAIPRLQPFHVRGNVVAVFAKYSPNRRKAVFAVAPGMMVTGPVRCRRKADVCRYLDIPAGSYARLAVRNGDGSLSRRRLDVVRIQRPGSTSRAAARRASRNAADGRCLLRKVLRMDVGDAPVRRDACA